MVQVVVEVGEDLGVACGDLRSDGQQDEIGIVSVERERLPESGEASVLSVAQGRGSGDGFL